MAFLRRSKNSQISQVLLTHILLPGLTQASYEMARHLTAGACIHERRESVCVCVLELSHADATPLCVLQRPVAAGVGGGGQHERSEGVGRRRVPAGPVLQPL